MMRPAEFDVVAALPYTHDERFWIYEARQLLGRIKAYILETGGSLQDMRAIVEDDRAFEFCERFVTDRQKAGVVATARADIRWPDSE